MVVQKKVEKMLIDLVGGLQNLPNNVAIEHFNNLRGIDIYKDVPNAIIVGRPALKNFDLEATAEAIYQQSPDVLDINYLSLNTWHKVPAITTLKDGSEHKILSRSAL